MIGAVGYKRKCSMKGNFDENALAPIGKRENGFKVFETLSDEASAWRVLGTLFARVWHG